MTEVIASTATLSLFHIRSPHNSETGGIMLAPGPWDKAAKPGAAMRPFPGVEPILLDSEVRRAMDVGFHWPHFFYVPARSGC